MRGYGEDRGYAVVLGTGVNGLGHIRALGREGVKVFGVSTEKSDHSISRLSRYCTPVLCKTDEYSPTLLIECLKEISDGLPEKPVLFATSDRLVIFISEHREVLGGQYDFNLPPREVLRTISNKKLVGIAAASFGLNYPEIHEFESPEVLEGLSDALAYPCIIKPDDSHSVAFPGKNHIVNDRKALLSFFELHPSLLDKVVVQRLIPGKETAIVQCTGYIDSSGRALQFCTVQKIHQYPPHRGIMTYGVTRHLPNLVEATMSFLSSLGYTGLVSVEYKLNEEDDEFYFIEANPRLPWYNGLFPSAGVNLPMIYFLDQRRELEVSTYLRRQLDDVSWMHFRDELAGMVVRRSEGEPNGWFSLLSAVRRARSFAYWSSDDPLPFLGSVIAFARWGLTKLHT